MEFCTYKLTLPRLNLLSSLHSFFPLVGFHRTFELHPARPFDSPHEYAKGTGHRKYIGRPMGAP